MTSVRSVLEPGRSPLAVWPTQDPFSEPDFWFLEKGSHLLQRVMLGLKELTPWNIWQSKCPVNVMICQIHSREVGYWEVFWKQSFLSWAVCPLPFFFFFCFYFSWRITALQYCFGLCHTSTWISHRYTYAPPSWTSHPSRLSQRTGFELPASYGKLPLAVYFTYGNIYVSMLLSQLILPSPSPSVSTSLISMSAFPLLPCK